jgi:hypothetical protein
MFTFRGFSCSVLVVLCNSLARPQTISFLPPVTAFVPHSSRAAAICNACLAIADFNGDGKPDIAFAYEAQLPFAGVVLGNGDVTFRPGAMFAVSELPGAIMTGDFNGDGKADVLSSGAPGALPWIAFGNGDGTFQPHVLVSACSGGVAAIADVNRDSKADLICGTSGLVSSVLLSNGDGTFRAGSTVNDLVLLAVDFNHDGNPDLLLHRVSGQLAVALGLGDGTFGSELPGPILFTGPIAGDFNGDGRVDLAGVCTRAGLICVVPGLGDGTFGPAIQTPIANSLPGNSHPRRISMVMESSIWLAAMPYFLAMAMERSERQFFSARSH